MPYKIRQIFSLAVLGLALTLSTPAADAVPRETLKLVNNCGQTIFYLLDPLGPLENENPQLRCIAPGATAIIDAGTSFAAAGTFEDYGQPVDISNFRGTITITGVDENFYAILTLEPEHSHPPGANRRRKK